jgi:xanthine dehydrogenase accessory factor
MLIVGAGSAVTRVLAQMALLLDFEVICCDPREEYHLTWDVPGTAFTKEMPDDLVLRCSWTPTRAVWRSRTTPSSTTWCCWKR